MQRPRPRLEYNKIQKKYSIYHGVNHNQKYILRLGSDINDTYYTKHPHQTLCGRHFVYKINKTKLVRDNPFAKKVLIIYDCINKKCERNHTFIDSLKENELCAFYEYLCVIKKNRDTYQYYNKDSSIPPHIKICSGYVKQICNFGYRCKDLHVGLGKAN